jgi:hypothetical protein
MTRLSTKGLDAFAVQFQAQLDNAGVPSSEHAVHFCIALGFQPAYDLAPGDIVFERGVGSGRVDLWVIPLDMVIEVKYRRPIPSGRNLPATQIFGSLLADFNKVAAVEARHRLVIYVSDEQGINYLRRSGRGVLPLELGLSRLISSAVIERLPKTAASNAVLDGPWTRLETTLVWQRALSPWQLLAWDITPAADDDVDDHSGTNAMWPVSPRR